MRTFTHAELVDIAGRWLTTRRNTVVVTELSSAAGEAPDAIGFDGRASTVIECKTSRSDFLADAKKYFRRDAWRGMGQRRYYMAPQGLLTVKDLPDGWGLIEVLGITRTRVIHDAGNYFEKNAQAEIALLISALRRVCQEPVQGVSVRCYTIQTQCKATLGVEPLVVPLYKQEEFDYAYAEDSAGEV